jgi:hypothetical protein
MRYLYDRFGGAAMLHRLYADTTAAAQTSANTHPILAAAGDGESFAQLYAEFAAALAVRGVATTASPYAFSRQVMLVGTKSLALPGPRTWNLVLNGPRSPDDLTSTQPYTSARIKLDVGVSASALLLQGATDFFNVAPASGAGAMVSGSAPAAAGRLGAALVQGAYDDNPSCLGPSGQCS